MKKIYCFTLLFIFNSLYSQYSKNIFTSDIDNYWLAFDKIQQTNNETEKYKLINDIYIKNASEGLKIFMDKRGYTDSVYIDNIKSLPKFWNSIRQSTLDIKNRKKEINQSIIKLKKLYPNLRPADIYFTIGGLRSGGTTDNKMVLIGSEIMVGNQQTDTSELENDFLKNTFKAKNYNDVVFLVTHEYMHTQQKNGFVNLLGQAIKEGSCDFIAELVLHNPIKTTYIDYGLAHQDSIKDFFKKEMYSDRTDKWLYNAETSKHPDLGYFIGYEIAKSYYNNSKNKKEAIKEIIELDFDNEKAIDDFLAASKFYNKELNKDKIINDYNTELPKVIKIEPFTNGDQSVELTNKTIKITFSKPLKNISFAMSEKGKEHFPLLEVNGFENENRTVILETIDLKPNTEYDFYINNRNTESVDGYKFYVPKFQIKFKSK